jgi:hypothetical protein
MEDNTQEQMLSDIRWLLSELGSDHWRECNDDGCYICEGHQVIDDRYRTGK